MSTSRGYKMLKLSSANVEAAKDCQSGEAIAESTVISATVDGVDQPENVEVSVDCQSGEVIAESTVISATVDGVDQPENAKVTNDKEKIDFRQVSQFRMSSNKPLSVEVKLSHDDSEQWKLISFQKRGRPVKLQDVQLLPLYNGPRHIAKAKVDDVRSLCVFIPPIHHDFYNNIIVDKHSSGTGTEPTELMDDDVD